MASPSNSFIKALIRYGRASSENLANLAAWQVAAIEEIAANKGGQLVSGSTNGSTFTQLAAMTNFEWVSCLGEVLEHIDRGTMPQTRTIARLA
jgi:hypothetical protein|tara:strand:+ start:1219 stop:1497 length:279 start_codon:yes stop_codon:yes gene_type:complete